MTILERFKLKLGKIDKEWASMKTSDTMSSELINQFNSSMPHDIKDFVLFNIQDTSHWFGINISGILIFSDEKLEFIKYKDILNTKIEFPLKGKTINLIKTDATDLRIYTNFGQYLLSCDPNGAVYKIKRLIDFGVSINNNLKP